MFHTKPDRSFLNDLQPFVILQKRYSKHTIEYYENPDDDWFIYVVERAKTNRAIKSVSMIIRKDLYRWLSHDVIYGWVPNVDLTNFQS